LTQHSALSTQHSIFYPDQYLVEEDQIGNSAAQELFLDYFKSVLRHLYRYEGWMVAGERNLYHQALNNSEKLIVPDIAVFKGINIPLTEQSSLTSWDMRKGDKACPPLVIEACSPSDYQSDIEADKKPRLYGLIGVQEYFAYDPNPTPLWPKRIGGRLIGWKYNEHGQAEEIKANSEGQMWSAVLEGWLEPNGMLLRLYNQQGQMCLTAEEASDQRAEQEAQARLKVEEQAKTEEQARRKAEGQAKTEVAARKSAETAKEKAWAKLRELGIDPETL